MNKIIQSISEFFRSKNITSHTVVVLIVAAATAVSTDQQVRDWLIKSLQAHPVLLSDILGLAGIILKYSRDSSTRGAALNILSDAQQPTAVIVTPPATITQEPKP